MIIYVSYYSLFNMGGYLMLIGEGVMVGYGIIIYVCIIGDYSFIGMGVCIFDGVEVKFYGFLGVGVVFGLGKVVGEGELWFGNLVCLVCLLCDKEIEVLYYLVDYYVWLKDKYLV